jgi:hypothetical protein
MRRHFGLAIFALLLLLAGISQAQVQGKIGMRAQTCGNAPTGGGEICFDGTQFNMKNSSGVSIAPPGRTQDKGFVNAVTDCGNADIPSATYRSGKRSNAYPAKLSLFLPDNAQRERIAAYRWNHW